MKSEPFLPVETAKIHFDERGLPIATLFDDVYFSKESGVNESKHVFLEGNQLAARFKETNNDFIIAELGFGSGLNFIVSKALWQSVVRGSNTLYYYAFEKHPLVKQDLEKVAELFPELADKYQPLIEAYPVLTPRWHQLTFGNVELRLWIGDALEGFQSLLASNDQYINTHYGGIKVDAFYLDGFAPKKNPSLWSEELIHCMTLCARNGTSFATYSCARVVRDGLQSAGFNLEKRPGFAKKREMLVGTYHQPRDLQKPQKEFNSKIELPWYLKKSGGKRIQSVAIIGSGLSGAHLAYFLAKEGLSIDVFEKEPQVASNASGNQQGLLHVNLSPFLNAWSEYQLSAYLFAHRFYKSLGVTSLNGMLKLLQKEKELVLTKKLAPLLSAYPDLVQLLDENELSKLGGLSHKSTRALFFPLSGDLEPPKLCQRLLVSFDINVTTSKMIAEPCKRDGKWEINGKFFDALVIANGHQANGFKETAFLPIKGIAGEITYLPESDQTRGLSYPVCAEGYLSRALNGLHSLGATYEVGERVKKPKNVENLERLESLLGLSSSLLPETLESRVSVRATTPDYVPILGAVPNKEAFVENYHELSKDAKLFIPEPGNYHQNLYVLTGLGSNGLTYAPLSAYLLASIMLGKPQATSTELLKALSPARFLIRDLIRGKYRKP